MADKKDLLKPIYSAVERLVPTNRKLINFVNAKARGEGLKRSLYKVKFIDKSERSTKQMASMMLPELQKHMREINYPEEEREEVMREAEAILEDAKVQVEKVYGEVRRYVVTSELRGDCVKTNYRKISTLDEKTNEMLSKEIFSLALAEINEGDKKNIDDIEDVFKKINNIAITLFEIASTSEHKSGYGKKKKEHKSSFGLLSGFFD